MNKRTVFYAGVALVLATIYITRFTDAFKTKKIQIAWRISAAGGAGPTGGPNVVFYLKGHPYPLTSVRVVETEDASTNKYPHALWHLVADPPVTTDTFNYGATIPGMKPEVPTAVPEPLQSDVNYSLLVEAGKALKGEKVFSVHDPRAQN